MVRIGWDESEYEFKLLVFINIIFSSVYIFYFVRICLTITSLAPTRIPLNFIIRKTTPEKRVTTISTPKVGKIEIATI